MITKDRSSGLAGVLAYAVGSFATGVFSTVPSVLLLYYCTQTLALTGDLAALIVFAPKIWALVWDPMVGRWSDACRTRFGRRLPFLLAGSIVVPAAFVALFNVSSSGGRAALEVGVAYFVLAIGCQSAFNRDPLSACKRDPSAVVRIG